MNFTVYQPGEVYDQNGDLIRSGSFGPSTPFFDGVGTGMYDYIVNNFEVLYNGVGGAAQNAADAKENADAAIAKAAEALSSASAAADSATAAADSATAAAAAKADAEAAAAAAAAISTPEGLAARVLALEGLPHYYYSQDGHLMFCYGSGVESS